MNPANRRRLLVVPVCLAACALGWLGYSLAGNSRVTADSVERYVTGTELTALQGAQRDAALKELEDMINRLPVDERRKWRHNGASRIWFDNMTEVEKGQFIDSTLPSGFKQWLGSFDVLPDSERKKFIGELEDSLRATHDVPKDLEPGQTNPLFGTNGPPVLSAELEQRARTIGLKTYFTQSSAQTKAELAPFLEELQRQMQSNQTAP